MPPPLECLWDWAVEGADLLAYPAWRARRLVTVREVEEAAWALCSAIDARLGEGAAKELLAWYDATPRADVLAVLLGEILASGGYDNRIRLWDLDTGKEVLGGQGGLERRNS